MTKKLVMIRDVAPSECSWLDSTLHKGLTVYEYNGCVYDCVSNSGIAITLKDNELPFMEVPLNAIGVKR